MFSTAPRSEGPFVVEGLVIVAEPGSTTARGYGRPHQVERARLTPIVEAGDAYCVQPVCVMRTRWIAPWARWDVAHDDSGTVWLGPAHRRCNRRDGAVRGNKMRARGRRATAPTRVMVDDATAGRWVL